MNIYLRDRLGSTVAVVDENGNYQQTTAYYPSGTPYQLPNVTLATAVDASTDRLHIGNKWMSHSGLNMYDNTARMHDPVLMHFASADPLYIKYPDYSPWSHCTANPVNVIDPSGMDIYTYDDSGNLVSKETDNEEDIVSIKDKEGHIVSTEPMKYGTIKLHRSYSNGKNCYYDIMQVDGAANGRMIFEFFAENTNIEFGLFITGENGKGLSFVTTSHEKDGEGSGYWLFKNQLRFGYTIISRSHNHPGSSDVSEQDKQIADQITEYLGGRRIQFNIYRNMPNPYKHEGYDYEYTSY